MCNGDVEWIRRGLWLGSLVIVHDGSYMKEVDPLVCSMGFLIYCTVSCCQAKSSIAERSPSADNYWAEILGAIMVQLVLRATLQGHVPPFRPVSISCDNKGVVSHWNEPTQSLPDKQPQADVLRVLKKYLMDNATRYNVETVF